MKHLFNARHCKEEEEDDGVSGRGVVSTEEEGGGGVFGLRCKTSPKATTGILFLFNFPVVLTRRIDWDSGGGISFSLLLDLSQSSLAQLGGAPQATPGTMGDRRERGKSLGRAVAGVLGSSKGGRVGEIRGGVGEVAREIWRVGRVREGDRGVRVGAVKMGG